MGCSSCPGSDKPRRKIKETYFLGEEGFVELKYNGWITPYRVYGEKQLYTFTDTSREKLVDRRDKEILLGVIVDGVKVFDTNEHQNP